MESQLFKLIVGNKYNIEITYPTSKIIKNLLVFAELLENDIVGVRPRFRDVQMFWSKAKGNKWKQSSSNSLNTLAIPDATVIVIPQYVNILKKIKLWMKTRKIKFDI